MFFGFFFKCCRRERVILQNAVPAQRQKEGRTIGPEEQSFLNAACYRFVLCERPD